MVLVSELTKIFDPLTISSMKDQEITLIADETEQSRTARKGLENQLRVLSRGADICKKFAKLDLVGEIREVLA